MLKQSETLNILPMAQGQRVCIPGLWFPYDLFVFPPITPACPFPRDTPTISRVRGTRGDRVGAMIGAEMQERTWSKLGQIDLKRRKTAAPRRVPRLSLAAVVSWG